MSDLDYLSEKASLFLLDYFQQIYKNLGLSGPLNTAKTGEKNQKLININLHLLD